MQAATILAWIGTAGGGLLACVLLIAESRGKDTPDFCPLKTRMWGRFVWIFLAGVVWLLFTDI